jgi:hypothetical protein
MLADGAADLGRQDGLEVLDVAQIVARHLADGDDRRA